jgi:hypothetical protein
MRASGPPARQTFRNADSMPVVVHITFGVSLVGVVSLLEPPQLRSVQPRPQGDGSGPAAGAAIRAKSHLSPALGGGLANNGRSFRCYRVALVRR